MADEHSERELENALVRNLRSFLSEMGGAFTFVGNQFRLEVDGKDYFIDLLLFHRRLRCLVAIELKIGELSGGVAECGGDCEAVGGVGGVDDDGAGE